MGRLLNSPDYCLWRGRTSETGQVNGLQRVLKVKVHLMHLRDMHESEDSPGARLPDNRNKADISVDSVHTS